MRRLVLAALLLIAPCHRVLSQGTASDLARQQAASMSANAALLQAAISARRAREAREGERQVRAQENAREAAAWDLYVYRLRPMLVGVQDSLGVDSAAAKRFGPEAAELMVKLFITNHEATTVQARELLQPLIDEYRGRHAAAIRHIATLIAEELNEAKLSSDERRRWTPYAADSLQALVNRATTAQPEEIRAAMRPATQRVLAERENSSLDQR